MSKKVIEAKLKGDDELTIKFNQQHWELIPVALSAIIASYIALHKDSGYKDYEINHNLKLLLTEAWNRTGETPKDIVEEI